MSTFGSHNDVSAIDAAQIAIWLNVDGYDGGEALTIYEGEKCTGASYSPLELLDVHDFKSKYGNKGEHVSLVWNKENS